VRGMEKGGGRLGVGGGNEEGGGGKKGERGYG